MTRAQDRAKKTRQRLHHLETHGTLVAYQCQHCAFTTILYGSNLATKLGEHEWPPGIQMTCCNDSELRPETARKGTKNQHNAMLHLMQQGHAAAARELWNRLDDADVDKLDYRTVNQEPQEDQHDE